MIETFTFAPTFILFFAAIIQALILIVFRLVPQNFKSDDERLLKVHNFLMHWGFTIPFLFGIVFIDTAIFWLSGQWGYGDWRYQLPAVTLILFIGIIYVVGAMFLNPRVSDIIFAIIATTIILAILHIYIPSLTSLRTGMRILVYVLILLSITYAVLSAINIYLDENGSWRTKNKQLWNWTPKFQLLFSRKFMVILYLIIMVEVWLKLFGSSILIWF